MFRRILVPLGTGEFAESALPLAEETAEACGAELHLVCVDRPAARPSPAPSSAPRPSGPEYLERLRGPIDVKGRVRTRTRALGGEPADALLTYARVHAIDLVVAAAGRGDRGLATTFLGRLGGGRVLGVPIPLLLETRPSPPAGSRPPGGKHVLIPLDGSRSAEQALAPALSLGRPLGARYTLLRVVGPKGILGSRPGDVRVPRGLLAQYETEARQSLERTAAGLRRAGLAVHTRVELADEPAKVISEVARADGAVIAMVTGSRGFSGVAMGAVALGVLRSGFAPLLLIHSHERRPALRQPDHSLAR